MEASVPVNIKFHTVLELQECKKDSFLITSAVRREFGPKSQPEIYHMLCRAFSK